MAKFNAFTGRTSNKSLFLASSIAMVVISNYGFAKDRLNYGGAGGGNPHNTRGGYTPSSPQSGTGEPMNLGHLAGKGNKPSGGPIETDSLSRRAKEGRNK